MMKKIAKRITGAAFILATVFCARAVLPPLALAGPGEQTGEILIIAEGLASDRGEVRFALAASEDEFAPDRPCRFKAVIKPEQGRASWLLTGLPLGGYAVKVFHDENGDGRLDRLPLLGLPTERYGFSNQASAPFGPPDFADARFFLTEPRLTIRITLK